MANPINSFSDSTQIASYPGSSRKEQNREVVANAARKYKQMPNAVAPGIPVVKNIKHNTRSIENSTRQQPAKTLRRQCGKYRIQGVHTKPPHDKIDNDWHHSWPLARQGIQNNPEYRQPPDHAKHPPTQATLKCDERKRSVSSCDQQVDGLVIKHLEHPFSRAGQTVIKSGNEIEQEQGKPIDAEADDLKDIPIHRGKSNQHRATGKRENRTNDVADTVKSFAFVHAGYSTCIVNLG